MNKSSKVLIVTLGFLCLTEASPLSDLFSRLKSLNVKKPGQLKQPAFPIPDVPDEYEQRGHKWLLNKNTSQLENMEESFVRKVSTAKNLMIETDYWYEEDKNGTLGWQLVSQYSYNFTSGETVGYVPENTKAICFTNKEEIYLLSDF